MGFIRRALQWVGLPYRWRFSESAPRPIDQMFREMYQSLGYEARVGRAEALTIPAVLKARNLICGVSTLPLREYDKNMIPVNSTLLGQIDPLVPNEVTLAQTVEDLLFEGEAWWRVLARDANGWPVSAIHVPWGSVSLAPPADEQSNPLPSNEERAIDSIWLDGKKIPMDEMIRFSSLNPGILKVAGRSIRRAFTLDRTSNMFAENPVPKEVITPKGDADPFYGEDDPKVAVREMLDEYRDDRKKGSVAYIGAALDHKVIEVINPRELQLVESQRQVALDIANITGLDPEDLGLSTTSRTYQNGTDRRQDRINEVYSNYMKAITGRLGMNDITPRSHVVKFDLDDYLRADPTTRFNVYEKALALGIMGVEEIREKEGLPMTGTPNRVPSQVVRPAITQRNSADKMSVSFDGESQHTFTVDTPLTEFKVDRENRIIEGIAVPYNKTAIKGGYRFQFDPGSLQYAEMKRVKLLRDHNWSILIGKLVHEEERPEGKFVRYQVARGADGDDALALASDEILDGLSVGVDFDFAVDTYRDPKDKTLIRVKRADWKETSMVAFPAFDDARLTRVLASQMEGIHMPDGQTEPQAQDAPATGQGVNFNEAALVDRIANAVMASLTPNASVTAAQNERPEIQRSLRLTASTEVNEPLPYRFNFGRNAIGKTELRFRNSEHDFSTDLIAMLKRGDVDLNRPQTEAGKRVAGFMSAKFDIDSADINELNPTIQRPDMYVDQRDYKRPIWDLIGRGAPPNGIQPFTFPKFNSASGLVGDHTEGVEPTAGAITTTGQTITPTALSGKAEITRETWDMGGNPAVSTVIWNQMVRGYWEGLESAAATFLNTLTAATDISLGAGVTDDALADAWETALARLQFTRGYDFEAFVIEQELYVAFAKAEDSTGRPLYPMIGPMNTNGQSAKRFQRLDLGGVVGIPSWALSSTAGSANNSWLFDPSTVYGWATPPQRLELPGTNGTSAAPVAYIDLAIWGYKAFANTDINGVRQVTYDTTA